MLPSGVLIIPHWRIDMHSYRDTVKGVCIGNYVGVTMFPVNIIIFLVFCRICQVHCLCGVSLFLYTEQIRLYPRFGEWQDLCMYRILAYHTTLSLP